MHRRYIGPLEKIVTRMLVFSLVVAAALGPGPTGRAAQNLQEAPLRLKVSSYEVRDASIVDALRRLQLKVGPESLIFGLEVAPFSEAPASNLTLTLQGATVKDVLDGIILQDPRYTYEVIDSRLIHVFPREARTDPSNLLNIRVKRFRVSDAPYDRVLKYPQYHIAELEVELMRRSKAGGYVASMMGGADAPRISLDLQDVTVRDVLNRIAQKTEKFPGPLFGPTGWIYTFRVDTSVPLGGHPCWDLF